MNKPTSIPPDRETIPNLASIVGPPFISLMLNWGLFGVLSTQVYIYYQAFSRERALLRAVVYTVYIFETAQTIILTQSAWHGYALNFGNVIDFDDIGTNWLSACLIAGIVAFLVQSFYAYRLSMISQNKIITMFIMLTAVTSLGGSLATSIILIRVKKFSELEHGLRGKLPLAIWEGTGSACDILIAVCMTYYLRKLSRNGIIMKTQKFVSRIIRLTVETGTITATVSILSLVLYYAYSPTPYYHIPLVSAAKLYSNTMMVAINSRAAFKVVSESTTWKEVEISHLQLPPLGDERSQPGNLNFKPSGSPAESLDTIEFAIVERHENSTLAG